MFGRDLHVGLPQLSSLQCKQFSEVEVSLTSFSWLAEDG